MQITNGIDINPQNLTLPPSASQLLFLIQEAGPFLLCVFFFFTKSSYIHIYWCIYPSSKNKSEGKKSHLKYTKNPKYLCKKIKTKHFMKWPQFSEISDLPHGTYHKMPCPWWGSLICEGFTSFQSWADCNLHSQLGLLDLSPLHPLQRISWMLSLIYLVSLPYTQTLLKYVKLYDLGHR